MQKPAAALLIVILGLGSLPRSILASDGDVKLLRSDSAAPYVHRITLYDHDGTAIDPDDEFAGPYSPRMTCSKCHPYATIAAGWHFNAWNETVSAGRPGEPWLLVDPQTGTQLPISGRNWPGTYPPEEIGLTNWRFVKMFGRHIPGGGFGEPGDEQLRNAPEMLRWGISGKLEIDCMFCHAADQQHDPAEAARQIEKENFKWAPTAALGLAVIRGEARKAPDDWDPLMPPDPDFPERAGPQLIWDQSRFDPDNRVLLNITRRPPAERCYFCHSFRQVGVKANHGIAAGRDVHLAAGLICVDCHRNGLDHMIVRGYRGEARERGKPDIAAFSCEGCHLGTDDPDNPGTSLGGRYGAPHPQHRGLPPLHFEKLTCTACHSGPWPKMNAKRFQTALAHGLGLATREREDDDPPHIVGPVFARQHDGRIAPQRMIFPTYFARVEGQSFVPVSPTEMREVAEEIVAEAKRDHLIERDTDVNEQITQVLVSLASRQNESVFYPYFRDRELHFGPWIPYRWSIAHNVRPASQSLGIRDCTDCHADDGPIFFGSFMPTEHATLAETPSFTMVSLRGDDATFTKVWNLGFVCRPAFKWFGFICAGIIALIILHYALAGIGAVTRRFR